MRDRKGIDLDGRGGGKELEELVRINCNLDILHEKRIYFNKMENKSIT